jgi:spermidine synthase
MDPNATLVLERLPGRLRLYLGGDLQFDTDDEVIYHERLAHPAMAATRARFEGPLDVLVLGGGDGLLVRELLKHEGVGSVRIVDCNPEVIALARGELRPFNGGSLDDPRVTVDVADARDALGEAGRYHAIFSDLTFPGTLADCSLFTRDWFGRLHHALKPGGLIALNGLSPDRTPAAYWCVYQTLRSAGLVALPGQYDLPSFAALGYGRWGFYLASDRKIEAGEILPAASVAGVRTLDADSLAACFAFAPDLAALRTSANPARDEGRTLFEALLDSGPFVPGPEVGLFSFLGFDDPIPPPEPTEAAALSPRMRDWLDRRPGSGIDDLLMAVPLSHRIVTRDLLKEWSSHLIQVARTLDLRRLVAALLRRAAALPALLVEELKRFRKLLSLGDDPVAHLTTWGWRFFSVLMLVIVLSQTAMPSAAYAKGFSGGGGGFHWAPRTSSYHHHSSSSHRGGQLTNEQVRRLFGTVILGGGTILTGFSGYKLKKRE